MSNRQSSRLRRAFPSPALVVAFVALFAAMGGFGYAAVKMKPNSVRAKNIKAGAVTTDKIADGAVTSNKIAHGAVTTGKFSPDAVAPNAVNAGTALNAAKLGGVAPGECQTGWLKAFAVINTARVTEDQPDANAPGFNCATHAEDAIHVHREAVGLYTVTFAGIGAGTALSSSSGLDPANAVTAASQINGEGTLTVKVWNNGDAQFVDGKTFSLIAF
jgi:hypothetical protein